MSKFKAAVKDRAIEKNTNILKKFASNFHVNQKSKKSYDDYSSLPVNDNFIFYESFLGLGILDSPRALFNYLLDYSETSHYTHVWAIDDIKNTSDNLKEYSEYSNIILVEKGSADYYKYLATCKYLITNSYFDYYFEKRSEQVYINTCCGIPFKHVGYDNISQPIEGTTDLVRNFLMADYLISANRFMTETLYKHAFRLDGVYQGKILELGYPRMDIILNSNTTVVWKRLENAGFDVNRKIILYAPTWRGKTDDIDYGIAELKRAVKKMAEGINKDRYQICLKVHYYLYKALSDDLDLKNVLIPFSIDTGELLSVTDILVTDYSAIFYDFLITDRPVLFYLPDYKEYKQNRGLYVSAKNLPGYATSDIEMVAASLNAICQDSKQYMDFYSDNYKLMKEKSLQNSDGHSCRRIVDGIFKYKNMPVAINTLKNYKTQKLVIVDINTANSDFYDELNEYLDSVNYLSSDVTILVSAYSDDYNRKYFNALSRKLRILIWNKLPYKIKLTDASMIREVKRCIGNAYFDEVKFIGSLTPYWAAFVDIVLADSLV